MPFTELILQVLAIAVAVGVLFFSIRSFKKQLQVTLFADYTKRYQDIMLNLPLTVTEDSFDFDQLDEVERDKTLRYMRAYFDLCSEELYLSISGDIEPRTWTEWEKGIKATFKFKAFRDAWILLGFNTEFYEKFSEFAQICIAEPTESKLTT
jgi:hypothetical protein